MYTLLKLVLFLKTVIITPTSIAKSIKDKKEIRRRIIHFDVFSLFVYLLI